MSLTVIRPYFRARLNTLGFKEWKDPFGSEQIPATLIDRAYHIEMGTISGIQRDNLDQATVASVSIRIYFKGFREPEKAMDAAILNTESIIQECMAVENWMPTAIKGVSLDSVDFEALDNELNDNVVFALVRFAARVNICVES